MMGVVAGLVISVGILGAWWLVSERWIDLDAARAQLEKAGLGTPAVYLAGCAYWILINSLIEEYVWRWFVFRKIEVAAGSASVGLVGSAFFFSVHHGIATASFLAWPLALAAAAGCFIGGATWSWLYLKYRSIWPAYLSHAIVDVAVFVVGWMILFG